MANEIVTPATSDSPEHLEAKETAHELPWGWLVLYFGLIAWGTWYAWAYTPSLGGWSQESAYQAEQAGKK